MKLMNWTPRSVSLFDDMDKMVKTVFNNSQYSPRINENWVPAVDIKEDNISFVISAPIFGYLADNHSLSYSFYTLAIIVGLFSILSAIQLIRLENKSNFAQ